MQSKSRNIQSVEHINNRCRLLRLTCRFYGKDRDMKSPMLNCSQFMPRFIGLLIFSSLSHVSECKDNLLDTLINLLPNHELQETFNSQRQIKPLPRSLPDDGDDRDEDLRELSSSKRKRKVYRKCKKLAKYYKQINDYIEHYNRRYCNKYGQRSFFCKIQQYVQRELESQRGDLYTLRNCAERDSLRFNCENWHYRWTSEYGCDFKGLED
ncbi:MAG: hypothetical protein MHMPM18_003513 [Marteilia pararefringens]